MDWFITPTTVKKKNCWWATSHVRPSLPPEVQWLSIYHHGDIKTVLLAASPSSIITCYYPSPSLVLVVQNENTMKAHSCLHLQKCRLYEIKKKSHMDAQMTFKLNNPLLNNREVTVHKMVQYYSGNNTVAHMHVHKHKVIIHYITRLYRTTLRCGWSLSSLEILEFLFHFSLELNYEHFLCYVETSHLPHFCHILL